MYEVIQSIARTLFVSAWADLQDDLADRGMDHVNTSGCELMDIAPPTPDSVINEAYRLTGMIEAINGASIYSIARYAGACDGVDRDEPYPDGYLGELGYYLAMMAMGHGVSWYDDHEIVMIGSRELIVPYFEFTSIHLENLL